MADIFNLAINFDSLDFGIKRAEIANRTDNTQFEAGAMKHQFCTYVIDRIFEVSQELVPVDTGNLYNSGYKIQDVGDYGIVYTAKYASYVHEIIEYNHNYPSRAKFLEDAAIMVFFEIVDSGIPNPFTFTIKAGYGSNLSLTLNSITNDAFKSNLMEVFSAKSENRRQDKSKMTQQITDWGLMK